MPKYKIVAIPDEENYSAGKKEKIIDVDTYDEAMAQAWKIFPEYHQIWIGEVQILTFLKSVVKIYKFY